MLEQYIPIGIMIAIGIVFGTVLSKASEWFGPKNPTEEKLTTYESGMEPVGTARDRFNVKFYIVAMTFIVFDIEVVFFYPWAVMFKHLGWPGFTAMALFVFVLLVGYFYEWKKGGFEWD